MSDPIWKTFSKLKSNCSGRAIPFPLPHSLIHITRSPNIFLTICMLLAGDLHMNPGPHILHNIRLATSTVRSVHNKLDILGLTET